MIPYKSILHIDKSNKQAIYLQLANQLINLIKTGVLMPNTKLPSSRVLSQLLNLHRKTIVACYDELLIQGWLVSIPQKGTYVHAELPILQTNSIGKSPDQIPISAGFKFYKRDISNRSITVKDSTFTYINDGITDDRIAPVKEISQLYRSVCNSKIAYKYLGYGSTYGNLELRKTLVHYLNETRGLKLSLENIMITRGSQMGIHLATRLLIEEGDAIIVGETNYISADYTFLNAKARLIRIPVDEHGIDTKTVEEVCRKQKIRALYVTSHHHHPTTATMSAERRLHLLNLSNEFKFAIIEDDYDYDFHYSYAPILPLASHDSHGQVIYTGSLCKTVAPTFRIGYIIAAKDFIDEAARVRRYIDRQGDPLLEFTFAKFIKSGSLDRHINKTIKIYRKRRDIFVEHLDTLSAYFDYEIPSGGMAFWLHLKNPYTWQAVAETARKYKLEIGEWKRYDLSNTGHNSIRLGFATYNEEETTVLFEKLKETMEEVTE